MMVLVVMGRLADQPTGRAKSGCIGRGYPKFRCNLRSVVPKVQGLAQYQR